MFKPKVRISAILLAALFSANLAIASPRTHPGDPGGVLARLVHLVKRLLPSPMDDPSFPRP